jgi:hypothetical protein
MHTHRPVSRASIHAPPPRRDSKRAFICHWRSFAKHWRVRKHGPRPVFASFPAGFRSLAALRCNRAPQTVAARAAHAGQSVSRSQLALFACHRPRQPQSQTRAVTAPLQTSALALGFGHAGRSPAHRSAARHPRRRERQRQARARHRTLMRPSLLPEAIIARCGCHSADFTSPPCPVRVASILRVAKSHTCAGESLHHWIEDPIDSCQTGTQRPALRPATRGWSQKALSRGDADAKSTMQAHAWQPDRSVKLHLALAIASPSPRGARLHRAAQPSGAAASPLASCRDLQAITAHGAMPLGRCHPGPRGRRHLSTVLHTCPMYGCRHLSTAL